MQAIRSAIKTSVASSRHFTSIYQVFILISALVCNIAISIQPSLSKYAFISTMLLIVVVKNCHLVYKICTATFL